MNKYQLIAFDMDGTLLNSRKCIDVPTLEALKKAADAGKTVALCTGRSEPELTEFLAQMPFVDYVISVSGARVFRVKDRKTIYENLLTPEILTSIFSIAREYDLLYYAHSTSCFLQKDQLEHIGEFNMGLLEPLFIRIGVRVTVLSEYLLQNKLPVYKLNLFCKNEAARHALKKKLSALPLQLVYSERTCLECTAAQATKGTGLRELCKETGIPLSAAIAVGDADNDLDVLKTAGLALAMGNANDTVKALAAAVLPDNDHQGCVAAIEQFLLK